MIVVADTTPIITLMKVHHLELLKKLFGVVYLPEAVYTELTCNPDFSDESALIRQAKFIEKCRVNDVRLVERFQGVSGLDLGESEAMILAEEMRADLLLMDEVKGRMVARQLGHKIMGSLGILRVGYESGYLSAEEITGSVRLLRTANRHMSEKLLDELLKCIDEDAG